MLRILDRLNRSLTWRLLSPVSNLPNGIEHRASDEHAALLGALQAAREQGFGVADRSLNVDERAADSRASHFLAVDHRGQIVGAVRLFVVDRRREPLTARLLVGFGRITFPSPADEMRHLAALERWLASTAQESIFVYAGGFFTTGRWRGCTARGTRRRSRRHRTMRCCCSTCWAPGRWKRPRAAHWSRSQCPASTFPCAR